CSGRYRGDDYW
nr:immunoglobulin heavy chain junction region [Macaca mulatta]MOW88889.1 immunoglobulin heavy chain junction region [Macaca mulatta]